MSRAAIPLVPVSLLALLACCLGLTACKPGSSAGAVITKTDAMNSVLWVQTSAEYRALCEQTFSAATRALDAAVADPSSSAAIEQEEPAQLGEQPKVDISKLPPAIICDLDETLLDNSPYNARLLLDGGIYQLATWNDWVEEEKAGAVPGAKAFLLAAKAKGLTIFYVTNRDVDVEAPTRDNLRKLGYPLDETDRGVEGRDLLLMRNEYDETGSEKTARRSKIAATHRIVMMLGDDLGDFLPYSRNLRLEDREARRKAHAERWGQRWFILPNPIYGSWTKKLEGRQRAKLKPKLKPK